MNNKKSQFIFYIIFAIFFVLNSYFVNAQPPTDGGFSKSYIINFISPTGQKTILEIIQTVLTWLVYLGFPIVAIFLIVSGIKFLTARGDEKAIQEAKRMLVYTIIGGAVVFGSFIIVNTIKKIIELKGFPL